MEARELERMTKDINSNITLVRREIENLEFRDTDVMVCIYKSIGGLSTKFITLTDYWGWLRP